MDAETFFHLILSNILLLLVDVVLILILVKEIRMAIDIRNTFKCKSCGTYIDEIRNNKTKCEKCDSYVEIGEHTWHHFFTHRLNFIKTKPKNYTYNYKSYIKYSKIEIITSSICIIIVTAYILIKNLMGEI